MDHTRSRLPGSFADHSPPEGGERDSVWKRGGAGFPYRPDRASGGTRSSKSLTSGEPDLDLKVPCAPHEADPGHTYRLAQSLSESPSSSWEPFPSDLTRIPVPDRVMDRLDGLSGCAARLCLLMIRASYSWVADLEQYRASSRRFTAREIEEEAGGLGMSRESLRRAAEELEARGWVNCRRREGRATTYRWTLSVPQARYTPVPAPLLHAHQALSHSALTLLLCVLRATWGWTTGEDGATLYRRTATLSTSDLRKMAGLSRPTIRSVQEELRARSALYARREHRGATYEWAVDLSFFRHHLQKSSSPSDRVESSHNTRGREAHPDDARTEGKRKGPAYRVSELWEEEAIRVLSADPIGMAPGAARDIVIRRARSVVEEAIRAYRRRRADIDRPAGWLYTAISELWFGSSIPNKAPDVRQSSSGDPIASAFEALVGQQEGWEWDAGEQETTVEAEGLDVPQEPTPGVTHSRMIELIDELGQPPHGWEPVERKGRDPLFVPTPELGNWCWRRQDTGGEAFQEAAEQVVQIRRRYEDR